MKKQETTKVEVVETEKGKSLGKTAKIIAISCFSLLMGSLLFATISDVIIFSEQLLHFIGGIIVTGMLFILMVIFFAISFVLIFGFYLVKTEGFWPLKVTINAFKEIMGDITFSSSQLTTLTNIRWSLLIVCLLCFASSIVSLSLRKAAIKNGFVDKNRHIKKFDVVTLIFSILGVGISLIVLLILK